MKNFGCLNRSSVEAMLLFSQFSRSSNEGSGSASCIPCIISSITSGWMSWNEYVGRLYDIEFINPALVFSRGVGLATRHVSSGASGVPRRVKVERRRQKQLNF